MRKIDYQILAQVIRELCEEQPDKRQILAQLARRFANRAAVKKDDFLRECGLK